MRLILLLVSATLFVACSSDKTAEIPVQQPPVQVDLPIADAGHPVTLQQGATVVLNASKSYDPTGKPITYQWRAVSKPSASVSELSDPTSPFPSFFLDAVGDFTFELIVNNGDEDSLPVQVTVSDSNGLPIADAGSDKRWSGTAPITLNGSGSFDSDGDLLSYSWTLVSAPSGSSAALARADTAFPVITPDVSGDYVMELIVSDGINSSTPDQVTVSDLNLQPVANAGTDQAFTLGTAVSLDASKSSDPDGDVLTYAWQIVSAPPSSAATVAQDTSVNAQFTPDVTGDYILGVVVNDGQLSSKLSTLTLRSAGHRPIASAGNDISATLGARVQLDGSNSSDLDGDPLTASWSISSKPKNSGVNLADVHTMHPTFTPDVEGDYVIALTVYDGGQTSLADSVTVSTRNLPPVANAGAPLTLQAGQVAHLNGSASVDPEGQSLSYQWSILTAPPGSSSQLSSATVVAPDFTPDSAGSYVFQLVVSDGALFSQPATVSLTDIDLPPVANAGVDQSVSTGAMVSLDGSASADPEGLALTYSWSFSSQPAGSQAMLSSPSSPLTSFTADVRGDYLVQLVVTDGSGQTSVDSLVVRDSAANTMPVANAGADLQVDLGKNVVLDGSGSTDADGDSLAYAWAMMSRPAGSTAQLNDSSSAAANFTPDVEGDFVFQLVVSDGVATSLPDVVMIHDTERNLAPTAVIAVLGSPQTGNTITLDSSSSSDPNGDALTYIWSLASPSGSSAVLSDTTAASPSFVADIKGSYLVVLTVKDGSLTSNVATQQIVVADPPPGAAISLPAGHNLMFLSTEGGDGRAGGLFAVKETDFTQVTDLTTFHGLPAFGYNFDAQGIITHPDDGYFYGLISGTGVYGVGAIVRFNPVTQHEEVFASIPRFEISGHEVSEFRNSLVLSPDGKAMYTFSSQGGENDAGLLMHINTDPQSANYRTVSVIAEIGKASTGYLGASRPLHTDLQWTGTNRLMALFGFDQFGVKRPALEFTASDASDLSQSWTVEGIASGAGPYTHGRKFFYANDTILTMIGRSPPVLDSMGRDGFAVGTGLPNCRNPFGIFPWISVDVYVLCERANNDDYPVLYKTNQGGAFPANVRQFSSLSNFDIVGIATSDVTSRMFMSLNDDSARSFLSAPNGIPQGLGIKNSRIIEVSLPNYAQRTLVSGGQGDLGSYFIGDPAIMNNPQDSINDRYTAFFSFNGGSNGVGAIISNDRGTGSNTVIDLGFERGGYPFGRVTDVGNGRYFFSVASLKNQSITGGTLVYDSSNGTLTPLTSLPRFFRPGLSLVTDGSGGLVSLGIDIRGQKYVAYRLRPQDGSYQHIRDIAPTADLFPRFEVTVDQSNIWTLAEGSLFCFSSSSSQLGQHDFNPAGDHDPVSKISFAAPGGDGYLALKRDASGLDQGAIQHVDNNCQLPTVTTVVSGLTDVPSTGLLLASDGDMYYGTESGKLMKFDTALRAVTEVAAFADGGIEGFLIEDSNGDIVGMIRSSNTSADRMFAYSLAGGLTKTEDLPSDRPLDPIYPGFTEIN